MRGVQQFVTIIHMLLLPKVLHQPAHAGALGRPEDQPPARLLLYSEQSQLVRKHAVIAALRLGLAVQIILELVRALLARAINMLQHIVALITGQYAPATLSRAMDLGSSMPVCSTCGPAHRSHQRSPMRKDWEMAMRRWG